MSTTRRTYDHGPGTHRLPPSSSLEHHFSKYNNGENKATDYCFAFLLDARSLPAFSLPTLTLDDLRYVLSRKLKSNTATGSDGWRPHELKSLPDCLLLALLDIFSFVRLLVTSHPPFTIHILFLFPRELRGLHLAYDLLLFYQFPIDCMLAFVARLCFNGRIPGSTPPNVLSVKDVALRVLIVIYLLIFSLVINP